MVAMVVAQRKLAFSPKKTIAFAVASPQITSALLTPTDAIEEKATTTTTIRRKVALTSPRPVNTIVGSTTAVKRPLPSTKETGIVAQLSKRVKRMAKKGKREILVISSQDTGTTIPKKFHPLMVEVSMGTLEDFPTLTVDQPATAQPTNLVDQLVQNPAVKELVVHPMIDPQPDIAIIGIGHDIVPVEVVADSVATTPLSNPKTIIVPFILDEEV